MSARLVEAGYAVRAYDLSGEACARFAAATGVDAAPSLQAAAGGADAVVLMLPSSAAVRAALLEHGLLDAVAPGALVVDMGSSEPTETRALAELAGKRGIRLLDAPVSGGVRGAVAGTLTIMVGGSPEEAAACRPFLEALGGAVLHVGPVGAGHALKALNNLLSATTLLASCEAILVGQRFGLDPLLMLEAINVSTGRSWSTQQKLPEFVVPRSYTSGFALGLMVKDMRIALGLARATQTPLRLGETSLRLWEEAERRLPAGADHTEIARWLESVAGDASGDGGDRG